MGDNDIYLSKEQADKLEKVITNNENTRGISSSKLNTRRF